MAKFTRPRKVYKLGIKLFTVCVINFSYAGTSVAQVDDSQQQSAEDNKVVVTGSRIKNIDIKNLSPVLSISREEMDKFGYANVKDVIDNLTQNSGGTFDNSSTFGFTPGASAVNLRGVGFGQTLTLIDGRRLPIYPIGINGTTNFVDLSSIPMAFVERIDILTGGASAVYGSDAVAGVINVITRKDIEGVAVNFRSSITSDGGYETQRFNLLTGARNGDTQLDVILDYWLQEPLWATDRDYANSDVANSRGNYSFGGASFLGLNTLNVYQDPDCGNPNGALAGQGVPNVERSVFTPNESWCGFDRSLSRQLIAPQERISLMTRISYEITENIDFFSRVGLSRLDTSAQLEANFYGGAVFSGFGSLVPNNGGIVLSGAINNPSTGTALEEPGVFVRRLIEFGPRTIKIENDAANLLAGFKGNLADGAYDWEFGYSYNKTELNIDHNNIFLSGLNSAVENGLDLFRPIPQQTVDFLSFIANEKASSTNRLIDFSIAGDLELLLDGGPVKFALAVEQVDEEYHDSPDPILLNGDGFDGTSEGNGERNHVGVGAELSFPFSEVLEIDIALRWDDYDDDSGVNSAFSPRLSLAYNPIESLLTRFSWGRSFRAPDMQKLFGAGTDAFEDLRDPDNGNQLVQSVRILTVPNIDLAEERGTNINVGFIWQANPQLEIGLDIYRISLEKVIAAPSAQFIVNACSEFDLLCELVFRDGVGSLNGSDALVVTGPLNFAEQETQGADLTVNYQWNNQLGQWNSTLTTTWIKSFYFQAIEGISKVDNVGLGIFPEYRTNLMLDWQKEAFGATFKVSYIDEISGVFCFICQSEDNIDSWVTLNANFRYKFSDFTRMSLGFNNLTNEAPPEDPTQTTWPWFSNAGSFYSAVGREIYLQLDMNF